MNTSVRSCLSSGVAVIGVSGLVLTAVTPPQQGFDEPDRSAVALTAQARLLPPAIEALSAPLDLIGRQAIFHVELLTDFLVTGAELFGRIPPIAVTLLQDLGSGAPLPTALSRALRDFADVEFVAGRELVGFAEDWANFQIQFLRDLVAGLPAAVEDGPIGALVTAALDVASQIVERVVAFSNAVITAAETAVGDVLGDDAEAAAPTQAVAAEESADPSPEPAQSRGVQPQVATDEPDEPEVSPDLASIDQTAEHSQDGGGEAQDSGGAYEDSGDEAEEPSEDARVDATPSKTRQPATPTSAAPAHEDGDSPAATADTNSDTDQTDGYKPDRGRSDGADGD